MTAACTLTRGRSGRSRRSRYFKSTSILGNIAANPPDHAQNPEGSDIKYPAPCPRRRGLLLFHTHAFGVQTLGFGRHLAALRGTVAFGSRSPTDSLKAPIPPAHLDRVPLRLHNILWLPPRHCWLCSPLAMTLDNSFPFLESQFIFPSVGTHHLFRGSLGKPVHTLAQNCAFSA